MSEYLVNWSIEVDADSSEEAAKIARLSQLPGTEALCFEVMHKQSKTTELLELTEDLDNEVSLKALVDITYRLGETEVDTTVLIESDVKTQAELNQKLRVFVQNFQDKDGEWGGQSGNPDYYWCYGEYAIYISNTRILQNEEFLVLKDTMRSKYFHIA